MSLKSHGTWPATGVRSTRNRQHAGRTYAYPGVAYGAIPGFLKGRRPVRAVRSVPQRGGCSRVRLPAPGVRLVRGLTVGGIQFRSAGL
jgi:hypothetical protein